MHLEHFTQPRHNTTSTITLTPAGDIWVDSSPPPEVPAFTFKVDLTPSSPRCGTPSLLWETLNEPPTSKWSTNYTQRTVVESLSKHPPPPQGFGVNLSWLHMFISESIKEVQVSSVPNENMIKNQVISYKHPSSTAIMERVGGGSNQVRKHVQLWKWWGKHTHKLAQKKNLLRCWRQVQIYIWSNLVEPDLSEDFLTVNLTHTGLEVTHSSMILLRLGLWSPDEAPVGKPKPWFSHRFYSETPTS